MLSFQDYINVRVQNQQDLNQQEVPQEAPQPQEEGQPIPTIGGAQTLGLAQPQTLGINANR